MTETALPEPSQEEPVEGVVVPLRGAARVTAPEPVTEPGDDPDTIDTPALPVRIPRDRRAELVQYRQARPPVVPEALRSPRAAAERVRLEADHAAYLAAYHLVRAPAYAARLVRYAPAGAVRAARGLARWVTDAEMRPLVEQAVSRGSGGEYLAITARHEQRVRTRAAIALCALVVAVIGGLVAPSWVLWSAAAALIAALGRYGAPADQPVIEDPVHQAAVAGGVEPLTYQTIARGLAACRIPALTKAISQGRLELLGPVLPDGPGWRAEIDLPHGVTAADVMAVRDRLASGLRRPLGAVWPEPVPSAHPGRLVLWVGNQEFRAQPQPAWPLLEAGRADLFEPVPFGFDQRGRLVSVPLIFNNVLIGAMPRSGKTFALRVLLLAAALDPTVELRIWELKGTGDLKSLRRIARRYGSGADEDTIGRALEDLRDVHAELERRAEVIRDLPAEMCPESKVTRRLADTPALGLHPLVLAIDECQELFTHDEYGEDAAKLATAIIKRGPALGIILMLATQRPDRNSLPTGVRANIGIRVCLRVMGHTEADMVLGDGMHSAGYRPQTFSAEDKGIAWLAGVRDDPVLVRAAYLDGPTAEAVVERAAALRAEAGTLPTGDDAEPARRAAAAEPDLLNDILAVVGPDEPKVWNAVVVDRLAELRPDVYGPWAQADDAAKTARLTAELRRYGVETIQVWGTLPDGRGANRRGITRDDVMRAKVGRSGAF